MNLYSIIVFLHVITAILGLGPIAVLTIGVTWSSAQVIAPEQATRLLRLISWGLIGMFITGAAAIALTRGALGETRWLRVSFGLFLLLGATLGFARRRLRKISAGRTAAAAVKSLQPLCWWMGILVVAITYLMEAKPW